MGFIAEEIAQVDERLVEYEDDGNVRAVQYDLAGGADQLDDTDANAPQPAPAPAPKPDDKKDDKKPDDKKSKDKKGPGGA